MSIPRTIHQIWYSIDGKKPPFALQKARDSVIEMHPDYEYRYWTEQNIDSLFDLEYPGNGKVASLTKNNLKQHFHNLEQCDKSGKSICIQMDMIKLMLVYQFGGTFLDHDMYCLRPLDKLISNDYCFGYVNNFFFIGEHIIATPAKDRIILGILQSFVRTPIRNRVASIELHHWVPTFGLLKYVHQPIVTVPHQQYEAKNGTNLYNHTSETHFVHLWREAYQRNLYDFNVMKQIQKDCNEPGYVGYSYCHS